MKHVLSDALDTARDMFLGGILAALVIAVGGAPWLVAMLILDGTILWPLWTVGLLVPAGIGTMGFMGSIMHSIVRRWNS